MGYQFDHDGQLKLKEDQNIPLKKTSGKNVFVNWSGFRISSGVSIAIVPYLKLKNPRK
jgi:hypothetical protein